VPWLAAVTSTAVRGAFPVSFARTPGAGTFLATPLAAIIFVSLLARVKAVGDDIIGDRRMLLNRSTYPTDCAIGVICGFGVLDRLSNAIEINDDAIGGNPSAGCGSRCGCKISLSGFAANCVQDNVAVAGLELKSRRVFGGGGYRVNPLYNASPSSVQASRKASAKRSPNLNRP
jgi:hypothetical protein